MRKYKLLFFAALMMSVLTYGCLKDDEENSTIVLFGEETVVKPLDSVFGLPMDTVLNTIQVMDSIVGEDTIAHDSIINMSSLFGFVDGTSTPDVRGEFKFDPIEVVWPTDAFEAPQYPIFFRFGGDFDSWNDYFHGQNHMVVHCDIRIPGLELNSEVFHSELAYVRGYGSHFTVYMERKQEVQTPVGAEQVRFLLSQGIAITGERLVDSVPGDIKNCKIALYNKEVRVLNPELVSSEIVAAIEQRQGMLTIYRDADNLTILNRTDEPYINLED